jgi:uncharacterized protein (DUF952 family)
MPQGSRRRLVSRIRCHTKHMAIIYKLCELTQWHRAEQEGRFLGAAVDLRDGFIHFSTAEQVVETAAKHFAGIDDVVLVAIEADALGSALKWEPSRGGDLFPHLYSTLPLTAVHWVEPLTRGPDGRHVFPDIIFQN